MKHYSFAQTFRKLYHQAVDLYATGRRRADTLFTSDEHAWLTSNGLTPQHLYDYAEDHDSGGEPGYDNALAIELVRRDYFLNVQGGVPSRTVLAEASLPPKNAAAHGIEWLPRLIPKARAKLRGELPDSLMYSCGGDRRFLKLHDIHPAEFLTLVWRNETNDEAVISWVAQRSAVQP